jgi:hypothetical protein
MRLDVEVGYTSHRGPERICVSGPVLADAEIQLAGYVHTRTLQAHPWLLGGPWRLLASCLDRPPRARERVSAEDPGPCGGRDAASGCQEVSTSMVTGTWLVRMS